MNGLSWRLLGRELRSGELRLLLAALVLAVAAVTAVGFFTDRIRQALEREALQLLGGDLLLVADHPWPPEYATEAAARGLRVANTVTFPSMVLANGQTQLVDVKAVSSAYPLRGRLSAADVPGEAGRPVDGRPVPGTVWLEGRLADVLGSTTGQVVRIGSISLPVAAILTLEPDRGVNFFTLAPRLMMHIDDLAASGLVQTGSRVSYRLLVAGDREAVDSFREWAGQRLGRGERLDDANNARPEIRGALERAERFLGLAALLTVVLSAVAVALAARRYMYRHLDACAVMRCLGITQGRLVRLHAALFAWLALFAALLGCMTGFAAHFVLVEWLGRLLAIDLPAPGLMPLLRGGAVAGVLLFGFAFPPLLQLSSVPTLRVLRRELGAPRPFLFAGYLLGGAALVLLMLAVAGDLRLGGYAAGGFAAALAVFWAVARLALRGLALVRRGGGFGWRQGIANLERHAAASTLQIVALALGLMALILLTVTRGELLASWREATPADAPNRFVINIQPDQRAAVSELLSAGGVVAELSPMVRGRLLSIGGRPVSAASYPADERAQRLVEREFNLSWRGELPARNRVVAGRWFAPGERDVASVEEGLARTLGITVGDELRFVIAGREVALRVTSLRQLEWDSMRVNFFVLAPPGVLDDDPASWITSFHLPAGREALGRELVARFPNLTVVDVGAILTQLQAVIEQVSRAVQFIFLFTLAAGLLVLVSALLTASEERRYELALLRALGASREQLRRTLLVELAAVGGLAGVIAAFGAAAVGQLLSRQALQVDLPVTLWLPPAAALCGMALAVGVGWLAARRLLAAPPMLALRAGE
jgi:putative ABC transport system permease protein